MTSVYRGRTLVVSLLLATGVRDLQSQASRDSAGVRIRTYGSKAMPRETWTLEPRPAAEIGARVAGGPAEFTDIAGVVRLASGLIAVADAGSSELRLFTPTGVFEKAFGRRGTGPGEFNVLWGLSSSADTLLAVDNTGRAEIFSSDGKLLRSLARPRPPGVVRPQRAGLLQDGFAIVYGQLLPSDTALSEFTVNYSVMRESTDAAQYSAPLLTLPAFQRAPRRGPTSSPVRYRPTGKVVVRGNRFCAGYSRVYAITCYNQLGKPLVRVEREVSARTISEDDKQFARQANLEANKGVRPDVLEQLHEENRLLQFADRAPMFSHVLLSATGELWVSEFDRGENSIGPRSFTVPKVPTRWSVYAANGDWLSDIVLPARFSPYDVGQNYVAGVSYDESDVERVLVWGFSRRKR